METVVCGFCFCGVLAKCLTFLFALRSRAIHHEVNGDEELRTAYPCPFCTEDFDLLELCCHIDLDHPVEAKSGVFFFCLSL